MLSPKSRISWPGQSGVAGEVVERDGRADPDPGEWAGGGDCCKVHRALWSLSQGHREEAQTGELAVLSLFKITFSFFLRKQYELTGESSKIG